MIVLPVNIAKNGPYAVARRRALRPRLRISVTSLDIICHDAQRPQDLQVATIGTRVVVAAGLAGWHATAAFSAQSCRNAGVGESVRFHLPLGDFAAAAGQVRRVARFRSELITACDSEGARYCD